MSGMIRDPGGGPVQGAIVELWGAQARLAVGRTDSSGRFRFPAAVTSGAVSILTRRIGYAEMSASLPNGDTTRQYLMVPAANMLPEVVTRAAKHACPRQDDPAARALWNRARSRYRMLPAGYGMSYDAMADSNDVSIPGSDTLPDSTMEEDAMEIGATLRAADTSRIHALGYAWLYYIHSLRHGSERRWRYPALGSYLAEHFGGDEFGARHVLTLIGTDGGELQIGFCARSDRQPEISGAIRLRADTSFLDATWRFVTPKPHDDAGGTVTFIPYRSGSLMPFLLAARSLTWHRRHVRDGYYAQQDMAFTRWWTEKTMLPVRLDRARVDTVPR